MLQIVVVFKAKKVVEAAVANSRLDIKVDGSFRVVGDVAGQLKRPVDLFLADWEAALQAAAEHVWPAAQTTGCWFHFAQAVLRKVSCSSFHCPRYYMLYTLFILNSTF